MANLSLSQILKRYPSVDKDKEFQLLKEKKSQFDNDYDYLTLKERIDYTNLEEMNKLFQEYKEFDRKISEFIAQIKDFRNKFIDRNLFLIDDD